MLLSNPWDGTVTRCGSRFIPESISMSFSGDPSIGSYPESWCTNELGAKDCCGGN